MPSAELRWFIFALAHCLECIENSCISNRKNEFYPNGNLKSSEPLIDPLKKEKYGVFYYFNEDKSLKECKIFAKNSIEIKELKTQDKLTSGKIFLGNIDIADILASLEWLYSGEIAQIKESMRLKKLDDFRTLASFYCEQKGEFSILYDKNGAPIEQESVAKRGISYKFIEKNGEYFLASFKKYEEIKGQIFVISNTSIIYEENFAIITMLKDNLELICKYNDEFIPIKNEDNEIIKITDTHGNLILTVEDEQIIASSKDEYFGASSSDDEILEDERHCDFVVFIGKAKSEEKIKYTKLISARIQAPYAEIIANACLKHNISNKKINFFSKFPLLLF